jgi:hypothetical protein
MSNLPSLFCRVIFQAKAKRTYAHAGEEQLILDGIGYSVSGHTLVLMGIDYR